MGRKILAIVGALIAGGLGVAITGFTQAAHAGVAWNSRIDEKSMARQIFALIGALIGGTLGIAVLGSAAPVHAGAALN